MDIKYGDFMIFRTLLLSSLIILNTSAQVDTYSVDAVDSAMAGDVLSPSQRTMTVSRQEKNNLLIGMASYTLSAAVMEYAVVAAVMLMSARKGRLCLPKPCTRIAAPVKSLVLPTQSNTAFSSNLFKAYRAKLKAEAFYRCSSRQLALSPVKIPVAAPTESFGELVWPMSRRKESAVYQWFNSIGNDFDGMMRHIAQA